jgi:hypothetical protein
MSLSSTSWRNRPYPKTWLILGIVTLLACAVLWIWLQLAARVTKENSFTDADPHQIVTVSRFPENLGSFTDIVPVLDLVKIADKQNSTHSPEFQTAAFIDDHESDWTLQVMNVSQENVITDFLAKRSDRSRFQYFRYKSGANDVSFILTYGVFTTVGTVMGALQTMNFGLPSTVRVFPERFSAYKPYITDSDNPLSTDLLAMQRHVKLRPVAIPPPTDSIEDKLLEIQSTSTAASGVPAIPAGIDGFNGQPDAPPAESKPRPQSDVSPVATQKPIN